MKMTIYIFIVVLLGIVLGYYFNIQDNVNIDLLIDIILGTVIFSIGIGIGQNKGIFKQLRKAGYKILVLPIGTIIGSWVGGIIAGIVLNYSTTISLAIASGFGWYSISAGILQDNAGPTIATIAFLSNVFREMFAFILIPILARKLTPYTAIGVAGATSMDTTLSLVTQASNEKYAVISFIHGVILSILVPILVPFFGSI